MKKMNLLKKIICPVLVCGLLMGCGNKEPIDCPYTDLGWETTEEALFEAKGDYIEAYNSTYGGQTYTYEGSYMGRDGIVKYMYDEDGVLMNVAWAYSSDDAEELNTLYKELKAELEDEYGKSDQQVNENTNYGDIWRMKNGDIRMSTMITSSLKAIQIAYVNPEAPSSEEVAAKSAQSTE